MSIMLEFHPEHRSVRPIIAYEDSSQSETITPI